MSIRSVRSIPSMRRALHSSSAAPNPSHLLSSQPDTVRSHFTAFTVQALKQECRQRGLKLTGRKVELIDRIVGFERAKSFSSTPASPAPSRLAEPIKAPKPRMGTVAFSSTPQLENPAIDAYTVPPPDAHSGPHAHTVSKIPVFPDSEGNSVEQISTKKVLGDTGASAGDVHVVDGSSSRVSTMNVDLGDGAPQHDEEKLGHRPSNNLPSGDKKFLWGLGAAIVLWWTGSAAVSTESEH